MRMKLEMFDKQQIKELLPTFLLITGVKELELLKNTCFLGTMVEKKKSDAFLGIDKYIDFFGYESYVVEVDKYIDNVKSSPKTEFLNVVIEPRYLRGSTERIFSERKKAMNLYTKLPDEFRVELDIEGAESSGDDTIAVYGVAGDKAHQIGFINRSMNQEIKTLLKEDYYPFVQSNIDEIHKEYSREIVKMDLFF